MAEIKKTATAGTAFGTARVVYAVPPKGPTGVRGRIGGISPKGSKAYQKMRERFQARISKGYTPIVLPG